VTADQLRDGYVRVTTINGVDVVMNERYHVLEELPDGNFLVVDPESGTVPDSEPFE
jgi:hypothetical protein